MAATPFRAPGQNSNACHAIQDEGQVQGPGEPAETQPDAQPAFFSVYIGTCK